MLRKMKEHASGMGYQGADYRPIGRADEGSIISNNQMKDDCIEEESKNESVLDRGSLASKLDEDKAHRLESRASSAY